MKKTLLEERWTKWQLTKNLPPYGLYVNSIVNSPYEFKILLANENDEEVVKILLDHSPYSYRTADETYRLNAISNSKFALSGWRLFKIENSNYISWLLKESCTISKSQFLMHFSIIATDSIVDIVDTHEPKVEFL